MAELPQLPASNELDILRKELILQLTLQVVPRVNGAMTAFSLSIFGERERDLLVRRLPMRTAGYEDGDYDETVDSADDLADETAPDPYSFLLILFAPAPLLSFSRLGSALAGGGEVDCIGS